MRAKDQLLAAAKRSPVLQDVYVEGLPPAPQVELVIDREKAAALGVTFEDINNTISTNLGSAYINDFPNRGRMQRVIVQADRAGAHAGRRNPRRYNVRNSSGQLVPLSSFATVNWSSARRRSSASTTIRRCASAARPSPATPAATRSREMERLAGSCRAASATNGPGNRCRRSYPARRRRCCSALSALLVFLVLAALYESWTIPLAVLLTVPLGMLGAVAAAMLRGLPNDVYFTVGLVTIIGLAAKDGILIIEFAKDAARAGQVADRGHGRGLPPALPADPDDRPRLRASASRRW